MTFNPDQADVDEHRQWLRSFYPQYMKEWDSLLKDQPEAAMSEAAVRRILQQNGCCVVPNEAPGYNVRRPDFKCTAGGVPFFVEVTCIKIDTATSATGLSPWAEGPSCHKLLTEAIRKEVMGKTPQCANLGHPALVAVGTYHPLVSEICIDEFCIGQLLTGEPVITMPVEKETGRSLGQSEEVTHLKGAAFLKREKVEECWFQERARSPVSGLLVCGLGVRPHSVLGLLHPQPCREFNPLLLPGVRFGRLRNGYKSGQFQVDWS